MPRASKAAGSVALVTGANRGIGLPECKSALARTASGKLQKQAIKASLSLPAVS